MEERGPVGRVGEHHVADVQARVVGDDSLGVCGLDWWIVSRAGLFSKGPEAPAFSEPEASFQTGLLRLFVVARGLALRVTSGRGDVDVGSRETAGLRVF